MIRQVDSSLLDEWEKMRNPNYQAAERKEIRPPGAEEAERDITRDTKAFTAEIRNRVFSFLRGLVNEDFEQALTYLSSAADAQGNAWTAQRLEEALDRYYADHERICLDPNARNSRNTYAAPSEDKKHWRIQQMLIDPEEHNDWAAEFLVDLQASKDAGEPVIRLVRIGALQR